MSRCFPFPPPGYVKKLGVEDVTLLAKEKDKEIKEKRHKKNKDKEKKEGKEKSKERRKEKDKEKHRDKDKKNGKKRSRDEKIFEGNRSNAEKAGSNSPESSCAQELEQRIGFMDGATRSQSVHTVNDRNQGKAELLDDVASRSNAAYWTEAKSGFHQMANGERNNFQSKFPKIVLSRGTEERTVQICKPTENTINKSTEGKDVQKHNKSIGKGEKRKDTNAKRTKGKMEMCTLTTVGYNGTQIGLSRETAIVQELERRVRDESGATGSKIGAKINVAIQKRVENPGKLANDNAISFSQTKENLKYGNGSYRLEDGPKENNQSKVPKVSIVHNFKTEERECRVTGDVDNCKNSPLEGMERGRYCEGIVDDRKKIQSKDNDRNKPRKEERVKEKSANVVKLSRIGQSSSDSIDNNKSHILRMSKKTAEVITSKRKEPEANGILHDNEMQPSKLQRTVISPQPYSENGKNLKTATTITLFASKKGPADGGQKLDDGEHKLNLTVGVQSPPVSMKSPSASVEPMRGPTHGQPHLGSTKPSISGKGNGEVGAQGSAFGPSKPPLSIVKVHGKTGSQESTKPLSTAGKVNEAIRAHVSPFITTKTMPHMEKTLETAKPPLTPEKVNATVGPRGSPPTTTNVIPHMEKAVETVGHQESVKPPLTPGKVNGAVLSHVPPPVTKKPPSTSRKEKRKDKSSSKPLLPHPDTKYLSQILSVPKTEELSEYDDTGWLFGSTRCSSKECDVGYSGDDEEQVWAKALHIKSADVYALPYVIPY